VADEAALKKNFYLLTLATVEKEECQQQATKADSGRFNLNSAPSDLEFIFNQKKSHLQKSSLNPSLSYGLNTPGKFSQGSVLHCMQ
jgi:hypothetical protein